MIQGANWVTTSVTVTGPSTVVTVPPLAIPIAMIVRNKVRRIRTVRIVDMDSLCVSKKLGGCFMCGDNVRVAKYPFRTMHRTNFYGLGFKMD